MRVRFMFWCVAAAVALAAAYYWIVVELAGYASVLPAPKWWMARPIGRTAAWLIWGELLNTSAMAIAAVPIAVGAGLAGGRRAVAVAAAAGAVAASYGLYPTFQPSVWPLVHGLSLAVVLIDSTKMAVLPALLAWALRGRLGTRPLSPA
jgi:hypothetical protein